MSLGRRIKLQRVGDGYEVMQTHAYHSVRYNRTVTIPAGFYSDGATWARDLKNTDAWVIHDHMCRYGRWDDGTKICNVVASTVLAIVLWRDDYKRESLYWWWATFLCGGGAARKNGMLRVKGG